MSLRMRPQNGALIHQTRPCRWVDLSWTPVPNYLSRLFGLKRGISRVGAAGVGSAKMGAKCCFAAVTRVRPTKFGTGMWYFTRQNYAQYQQECV